MDDILLRNVQLQLQLQGNRMRSKRLEADFSQFVMQQVVRHPAVRQLKHETPLVLVVSNLLTLAEMENTHEIEQQPAVGRFMNGVYFRLAVDKGSASLTVIPDHHVYDDNNNSLSHGSYWFEEEAEKPEAVGDDPRQLFDVWLQNYYNRLNNPVLLNSSRFKDGQKALEIKFNNWETVQQQWLLNATKEINEHAK
jgi:hypothetical protein